MQSVTLCYKFFFTFFWYDIFICLQYICALCYICQVLSSGIQAGAICLQYICIVLDLAVGVAVCKVSVLNWLGRAYAQLHCAMLIYMQCSSMQGICAQMTRQGLCSIALCYGKFHVCQTYLVYWQSRHLCLIDGGAIWLWFISALSYMWNWFGVPVVKASMLDWLG